MRLFLWELRKIWRPFLIITIAFVVCLLGLAFLPHTVHPRGYDFEHKVLLGWVEEYGLTLEKEERLDLEKQVDVLKKEADRLISSHPELSKFEIHTYEEFAEYIWVNHLEGAEYDSFLDLYNSVMLGDNAVKRYQTSMELLRQYDERNDPYLLDHSLTPTDREHVNRANRLKERDGLRSLVPYTVLSNVNSYFAFLIFLPLVAVFLLVSHYPVRERVQDVRGLQWTSVTGRKLAFIQFGAAFLSSFVMTAIILGFSLIQIVNFGVAPFLDCSVHGFSSYYWMMFDMTLREYLLFNYLLSFLLSMGGAAFAFLVSQHSSSYVSMVFKELAVFIPFAFVAFCFAKDNLLDSYSTLYPFQTLGRSTGVPGAELLITAAFFVLVLGGSLADAWLQKKRELL